MTNTRYIEKIVSSVDRIMVDTSSLMSGGFRQFIANNRELLLAKGKKILVPKAVCSELARHIGSDESEKSDSALSAFELLSMNKELFQVESTELTDEEIAHAFADAQLLSELTLHRSDCNQLLITNDRGLSCDAFDLNQQQSCKGRKVLVCYINWYGEMQCCDCARTDTRRTIETAVPDETEVEIEESRAIETEERDIWTFDWKSGVAGITGAGILYALFRGGKAVLRYI